MMKDLKIQLVQQETPFSCGQASVAMLAGVSFQEVMAASEKLFPDCVSVSTRQKFELCVYLGLKVSMQRWPAIYPDNVYSLVVPSLNKPGHNHSLVLDYRGDEGIVLDPLQGKEGLKWYGPEFDLSGWGYPIRLLRRAAANTKDKEK